MSKSQHWHFFLPPQLCRRVNSFTASWPEETQQGSGVRGHSLMSLQMNLCSRRHQARSSSLTVPVPLVGHCCCDSTPPLDLSPCHHPPQKPLRFPLFVLFLALLSATPHLLLESLVNTYVYMCTVVFLWEQPLKFLLKSP
jgi:hypothetical protein